MPEPATTTGATGAALVAIATSIVGAQFGPLATVAFAGFVGALISLGEVSTAGRIDGLKYVARYVLMAVVLAGTLSWLIERYTGAPAVEVLALVAFLIGWIGNRWQPVLDALLGGVLAIVRRRGDGA